METQERIIKLYHEGNTFQNAIARISEDADRPLQEGFYNGIAAVGQLTPQQAAAVLNACDPPGKAKCIYVIQQIAEEVGASPAKVQAVLREHFGLPPSNA